MVGEDLKEWVVAVVAVVSVAVAVMVAGNSRRGDGRGGCVLKQKLKGGGTCTGTSAQSAHAEPHVTRVSRTRRIYKLTHPKHTLSVLYICFELLLSLVRPAAPTRVRARDARAQQSVCVP